MSSGTVIIIAPGTDPHATAVRDRLTAMAVDAVLLDPGRFPGELRIALGEAPEDIVIDGRRIDARSVYIRDLALNPTGSASTAADLDGEMQRDWRRTMAALRERSDFVLALLHRWEQLGTPIYNPLSAYPRITKPYQLALLAAAGLPVPASCWTNDPEEVRRFARGRRVAYKPVAGGAATQELQPRDLEPARLACLGAAPVCFQELLPGLDLRIYVVDGEVVTAIEIESDALDFRQHERSMKVRTLDDGLRRACERATAILGLRFTGMDVKFDARGAPRILELNPSPMFLGFDARCGTDIAGALAAALAAGRAGAPALAVSRP